MGRLPYLLNHPIIGQVKLKLKCREYLPGILAMTAALEPCTVALDSPRQLILLQSLNHTTGLLYNYITATLGLWASRPDLKLTPLQIPKHFPCIDVEVLNTGESKEFLQKNRSGIVGALIRNSDYETMDKSIVKDIYSKNAQLNKKSTQRLLLVDKQGILQIRPSEGSLNTVASQDLQKVHDLAEMALVFAQLLDRAWSFRSGRPDLTDFSLTKVLDWVRTPQAHLSDSVTNLNLWGLLAREFHLEAKAESVADAFSTALEHKRSAFSSVSDWWMLPDLPTAIRNAIQGIEGLKFKVIKDPAFRSIIAADLEEAERSLDGMNYKATLILSGSVVEAILVALHKAAGLVKVTHEKKGLVDFAKAGLADLIYSSGVNKLVKQDVTRSLLHSVREYRNLIHPDNQMRKSVVVDRHSAEIALRVAKLLVREA